MSLLRSSLSSPSRRASRYRALADSLAAGIPARKAIELVRFEGESQGAAVLGRDESLTDAIERLADSPRHHRIALQAAEKAGALPETLRRLADEIDSESRAWRTLWLRSAYPLIVLHLVPLAASTSLLVERPGSFVQRVLFAWLAMWLAILGGAGLLRWITRDARRARAAGRWPLLGPLLRLSAQRRFLGALASLYGAGVRIDHALSEASASVGRAPPVPDFALAAAAARNGDSIEKAMSLMLSFEPAERMELVAAAQTGNLEPALRRVAAAIDERLEARLQITARAMSALLYAIAIVVVIVTVVSFYAGYLSKLEVPR